MYYSSPIALVDFRTTSSLLHLWIFAPPVAQKSRLSGMLRTFGSMEFAGQKIA
jgi:hypothetical protein